jgi:SAM-dependent methyltransferase
LFQCENWLKAAKAIRHHPQNGLVDPGRVSDTGTIMKIYEASQRGYKHKNLIFWLAMIKSLSRPLGRDDVILDFGCGSGLFLQLLYESSQYGHGYGIDLDASAIADANAHLKQRDGFPILYRKISLVDVLQQQPLIKFDAIFCQEVFWMNEDLYSIACTLHALLKPGGRCYCTVGCHAENPLWSFRKDRLEVEGCEPYTHHLDEIARIFSAAGFAVGMRRLPLDGFIMFHPDATILNAGSFSKLVATTYDHKMLFYFGKTEQVAKPENIHD